MVVIRLSRGGTNKRPFYHMVATDKRRPRDAGYLERIGIYNPIAKGQEVYLRIEKERLTYWLTQGAQTSEKVQELIKEFNAMGIKTGLEMAPVYAAKKEKAALRRKRVKAKKTAEAAAPADNAAAETEKQAQ